MAMMPSIMSLFGGRSASSSVALNQANPVVAATQTANAVANPSVPSPGTPASTGSVPAIPAAATGANSPLDKFNDLWKTDPNTNQQTTSLVPAFNLDHTRLRDASKKINFTEHLDPAMVQKAMSGDGAAFLAVMNETAQLGFANALAASGELVKQSLTSAQTGLQDHMLPAAIRQANISQAVLADNPIFADPSVSPMLKMVEQQFSTKYPTATPQEIALNAKEFLGQFASKIVTSTGGAVVQPGQAGAGVAGRGGQDQDWSKFFGE